MANQLPPNLAIRNLLEDLLGREVTVSPTEPPKAVDILTTMAALYVADGMKLSAVLGLDLRLAAFAGAALGLVPVGGAEDCIEDKKLSPMLAENVSELCNVFTGLLNKDSATHLKLYQIHLPGEAIPGDASGPLVALGYRLDLKVEVNRYGTGRLSLALIA